MRKIQIQFLLLLLLTAAIWIACKKQESPAPDAAPDKPGSGSLINNWLERQKETEHANEKRVAAIGSLQANLDYSSAWEEKFNEKEVMILVPIKAGFVSKNNSSRNSENYLLVFKSDTGIRRGNIVQYSKGSEQRKLKSRNVLTGIFKSHAPEADGIFSFLSVTDEQQYELNYDKGALKSYSRTMSKKPDDRGGRASAMQTCWAIYWVTTWSDGTEEWTYMFTYCTDECQTTKSANGRSFRINCSGGGGSGEECCIPDVSMSPYTIAMSTNIAENCGIETIDPMSGLLTKTCTYDWFFAESSFLFWRWKYRSIDEAKLEKVGNEWQFRSLRHMGTNQHGTTPPCVDYNCNVVSSVPSIAADRKKASMMLFYGVSYAVRCNKGGPHSTYSSGTATTYFFAK